MKKAPLLLCILLIAAVAPFQVFAQEDTEVWWGSNYMPGNFIVSADISYESRSSSTYGGIGIYPEAEYIIYKPYFGGMSPLDIGAAVRGHIGFGFDPSYDSPMSAGVGALVTLHFGLKGLNVFSPEIVDNIDFYSELGVGFDIIRNWTTDGMIVFIQSSGIQYHLSNALAVKLGYTSWGSTGGACIGAHLKFGPGQNVVPKTLDLSMPTAKPLTMPTMPYTQIYLAQFYALYWYVFAAGGYFFDDSTYQEGQGTRWTITSYDDKEGMTVERALLKVMDDGSKWWKISFSDDEDMKILYEVKTDPEYRVVLFRFRDGSEDQEGEYVLTPEEIEEMNPSETYVITKEEYADWIQGKEKITTGAGSYNTDHVMTEYSDGSYTWTYNWWITDKVPGSMVMFKWLDSDDEWYQGELVKITSNNKPELGDLN